MGKQKESLLGSKNPQHVSLQNLRKMVEFESNHALKTLGSRRLKLY
jgi:hypothetical protein